MDIEFYGLKIFCQVMSDKTFSGAAKSLTESRIIQ